LYTISRKSLHKIVWPRDSSLRNQRESPLLRLPAKIRDLIFKNNFTINRLIVDIDNARDPGTLLFNTVDSQCIANGLCATVIPITTVCRQVYAETSTLPFTMNVMEVGLDHMMSLVYVLPPKFRRLVKEIKVYTFTYRKLQDVDEVAGNHALAAVARLPELEKITLISLNMEMQFPVQEKAIASMRFNVYSSKQVVVEQELIKHWGKAREGVWRSVFRCGYLQVVLESSYGLDRVDTSIRA
jgi:hypothetical protein